MLESLYHLHPTYDRNATRYLWFLNLMSALHLLTPATYYRLYIELRDHVPVAMRLPTDNRR